MAQGESDDPFSCSMLGRYCFDGIEHEEGADAILDIAYAYDANGVVQVSAVQRATGRALPMTVEPLPDDMSWLGRPPEEVGVPAHLTVYLAFDLSGSMSGAP